MYYYCKTTDLLILCLTNFLCGAGFAFAISAIILEAAGHH